MKKKEIIKRLWYIYLDACICAVDWGSSCECPASDQVSELLRELVGEDWHEQCRKQFP